MDPTQRAWPSKLAFAHDAFVSIMCILYPILTVIGLCRQLANDCIGSGRNMKNVSSGRDLHVLTNGEFVTHLCDLQIARDAQGTA